MTQTTLGAKKLDRMHGTLSVEGASLRYSRQGEDIGCIPISSIRLIGEYTTDHGPFIDDYFLVFICGHPPVAYETPMYANPVIYAELGALLNGEVLSRLANRTDFSNCIIWPPSQVKYKLYRYEHPRRGPGLWNRFKDWFFPQIISYYTNEVQEFLEWSKDEKR